MFLSLMSASREQRETRYPRMSDAVIAALITGAVSLVGIIVSYWLATKKSSRKT